MLPISSGLGGLFPMRCQTIDVRPVNMEPNHKTMWHLNWIKTINNLPCSCRFRKCTQTNNKSGSGDCHVIKKTN